MTKGSIKGIKFHENLNLWLSLSPFRFVWMGPGLNAPVRHFSEKKKLAQILRG